MENCEYNINDTYEDGNGSPNPLYNPVASYGPQHADHHFSPNAFTPNVNAFQPPLSYPPPTGQHHQPYFAEVAPSTIPQQHPQVILPASTHQYGRPTRAAARQRRSGGAPSNFDDPSLSLASGPTDDVRGDHGDDNDYVEEQDGDNNNDVDVVQENDDNENDDDGNDEPVFHLPPPPESTYPNEAAMEEAVHSWSLEHGYELVRRASKKNARGVLYKRYMHCSKHGKAANTSKLTEETRIRHKRKSQRINCPMSIAAVAVDPMNPEGEWQVRHRKTHHNHGPLDALNLVGHRRRARAGGIEQAVDGLFAIGTPTAQVLQFLQRTNPHGLFTRTDVANMKLKYKKFGTCLVKGDAASHSGVPCNQCTTRKTKCDGSRPTCASCAMSGIDCEYAPEIGENAPSALETDGPADTTEIMQVDQSPANAQRHQTPGSATRPRPVGPVSQFQQNAQRAEEILANLQAFQAQHVTPVKLDLQSSAVEVLAASSCGSGESYKKVPMLRSANEWQNYRDLMTEACMKENTFDVLMGSKVEPVAPPDDCPVEEWNEYIKKLAIFNRRNTALTGALWGSLAQKFRNRVQHLKSASEIWSVLESSCLPHGSEDGYKLYLELHDVTHADSDDLKDYIVRLENAYLAFNRLSHHWRLQHDSLDVQGGAADDTPSGNNPFSTINSRHPATKLPQVQPVFSEEMLCFLFLRNLKPEFNHWIDVMCSTNNIAGFGTGPRVGFVELTRKAVEYEIELKTRGSGGA